MNTQGWLTRSASRQGGEGQTEASLGTDAAAVTEAVVASASVEALSDGDRA